MTDETLPSTGVTRRDALKRGAVVAGGAAAVWAAPSVTTLSRAFAEGSEQPGSRAYKLYIQLVDYGHTYDHYYDVTLLGDGSFSGTGYGVAGDTGVEHITGTFVGGVLTYSGSYTRDDNYSYTIDPATVSGGAFSTTIHTTSNGAFAGDYAIVGTFQPA